MKILCKFGIHRWTAESLTRSLSMKRVFLGKTCTDCGECRFREMP